MHHLLETNYKIDDLQLKITLSAKLISSFYLTKNEEFFKLAEHFCNLESIIKECNDNFSNWDNLFSSLNLCLRYKYNSPEYFDNSRLKEINWEKVYKNRSHSGFSFRRIYNLLLLSVKINPISLPIFIKNRGKHVIKRIYISLNHDERLKFKELLRGQSVISDLRNFEKMVTDDELLTKKKANKLFREILFSEKKFSGKIFIDDGAKRAISKFYINLLPAGIINIEGVFYEGSIVGIFNRGTLIGVGITEYSSENLNKIKKKSSYEFQEIIGYFHTNCAVKTIFLKRLNISEAKKWIYDI